MGNKGVLALGFGLLVLLGVLAIPTAVDSSNSYMTETQVVTEGESSYYGENLQLAIDETTSSDVTLTAIDNNGDTVTRTINETDTAVVTLQGQSINITAEDTKQNTATLTVDYPSIFGYSDAAVTIRDNLPIILVAMLFIGIMGFVGVKA